MRHLRLLLVLVALLPVVAPVISPASASGARILRAPYVGAYEFVAGSGGVGFGCVNDNCLRFRAGRYERHARVVLRDAYASSVAFVVWDTTGGDADTNPTRHGCGSLSFRITPGHWYQVLPQDGVQQSPCMGVATRGTIVARLTR